jgi:CRISPR system Cascade subunit CasE
MYLSQLIFNLRSREARFDLSDRHELHRTLLCAFPQTLPDDERVLYRVEMQQQPSVVTVLVQSHEAPEWGRAARLNGKGYLHSAPAVRVVEPRVQIGERIRFRLQANPTVKRHDKRHALYAEDALRDWMARKAAQHGFSVAPDDLRVIKLGRKFGRKRQQTWHVVQFDGVLTVTDQTTFHTALARGIGSGKAYGFGLLSIPYDAS